VNLSAQLTLAEQAPESVQMVNISLGGAFVAFHRVPMGTRLTLSFRIPQIEEAIETMATVRWATDEGIGVQFDGLRAKQTWALTKFFESLE
jgi:hypothetical protein